MESRSVFRAHILSGKLCVDKTKFIVEVIKSSRKAFAICRPPMSGKTFNLDMLKEFLQVDRNGKDTFKNDTTIMKEKHKTIRDAFMNKVPVISISFAPVAKSTTFENARSTFNKILREKFEEFQYVRDKLEDNRKIEFDKYFEKNEWSDNEMMNSIADLCNFVFNYYKVLPFLIIDEIDTPIVISHWYGYLPGMKQLMHQISETSFKAITCYGKLILAGVVPIPAYISDVVEFFDISNGARVFKSCFGLTKAELHTLMTESGQESNDLLMQQLNEWYAHFKIGEEQIYSLESVLKCRSENWRMRKHANPWEYMNNATTHLLTERGVLPALNLQVLMTNQTLLKCVSPSVDFETLSSAEQSLWRFLFHAGLVIIDGEYLRAPKKLAIRLPGRDLQMALEEAVVAPLITKEKLLDYVQFTALLDRSQPEEMGKWVGGYIQNAGPYLFQKGMKAKESDVAEYIQLVMKRWTSVPGRKVTVESKETDLVVTFYNTDGTILMSISLKPLVETLAIESHITSRPETQT